MVFGESLALLLDQFAFALNGSSHALEVALFERTFSRFVGGIEFGLQCPGQRVREFLVRTLHTRAASRFTVRGANTHTTYRRSVAATSASHATES